MNRSSALFCLLNMQIIEILVSKKKQLRFPGEYDDSVKAVSLSP